ncbi:DUF6714 family protein [Persicirhabdus sediminis]|uniref:Uncharacterized protein n=1 Tax=Persicirhabdus sediminis TaxID=454144 RepID=A0A8J7MEY1_9BACT|nr:DUF6714 family protein [Persicirhabdus sediminis]MBK1790594.1 hypothetical protein [Persicirhabdus sediminis]
MKSALKTDFPSREELRRQGVRKESIADLYDLWCEAHGEAMKLALRLPDVFGDPPKPRITLHVARGYDDEWVLSEARCKELAAMDCEQHWMDVSLQATEDFQEYFTFSDSEGWRFYLPAFIRHYLADFPLSGSDAVVFACENRHHIELLTPEQIEYLDEFLQLCKTWEE